MIRGILFLYACLLCLSSPAQFLSNSALTGFGAGEDENTGPTPYSGMASAGLALSNYGWLNLSNPASLNSNQVTVFESGLKARLGIVRDSSSEMISRRALFDHIVVGVPLKKRIWNAAFGLRPAYSTGYNFKFREGKDQFLITENHRGQGSLNRVFLSQAITPQLFFKDSLRHSISIGLEASYLFGNYVFDSNYDLRGPDSLSSLGSYSKNQYRAGLLNAKAGLLYRFRLPKERFLSLALTYEQTYSGNYYSSNFDYRYFYVGTSARFLDTVSYNTEIRNEAVLPSILQLGLGYTTPKWQLALDFIRNDFTRVQWFLSNPELPTSSEIRVGMQYFPGVNSTQGFLKHTHYRSGLRYKEYAIRPGGTPIQEYAVAIGAGFPLKKSTSTVNLAVEAIQRIGGSPQLTEQILQIKFGVALNDRWFDRRKFD